MVAAKETSRIDSDGVQFSQMSSKLLAKKAKAQKVFGEYPVWKAILVTMIPTVIAMLTSGLYQFFDAFLSVRLLDAPQNVRAAQQLVQPLNMTLLALSLLVSLGCSTRFSMHLGAKRYDLAQRTTSNGFVLLVAISVLITATSTFLIEPIMIFQNNQLSNSSFEEGKTILNLGYDFMSILIFGFVLLSISQFMGINLRSAGQTIESAVVIAAPAIMNIVLDIILLNAMKTVQAAALATVISWGIGCLMGFFFYFRNFKNSAFRIIFKYMKPEWKKLILPMFIIGLAPFGRNFGQAVATITTSKFFQDIPFPEDHVSLSLNGGETWDKYNAATAAEYGAAINGGIYWVYIFSGISPLISLLITPAFGIIQAGRSVAAFNYGANNRERFVKTTWGTFYFSLAFLILILTIGFSMGGLVVGGFNVKNGFEAPFGDTSVVLRYDNQLDDAKTVIFIIFSSLPIYSIQFAAIGHYQSTNSPFLSIFFSLLRGVILEIPMAYIMSEVAKTTNNGFWYYTFYPFADIIGMIICVPVLLVSIKRIRERGFKKMYKA